MADLPEVEVTETLLGDDEPTYTLDETIAELEGYFRGERVYAIELAFSAVYWLERIPERGPATDEVIACVKGWLADETPKWPEHQMKRALLCLRALEGREVSCDICRDAPKPDGLRVRCKACGAEYGENAHVCHATGCNTKVPPKMLMCRRHWFMVPKPLRDAVWREYRPGQEIRKDPTDEYMDVQRQAVEAVERAESAPAGRERVRQAMGAKGRSTR